MEHYTQTFIDLFIGLEKIVRLLIQRGADVNAIDEDGNSALTHAANNGNISHEFNSKQKITWLYINLTQWIYWHRIREYREIAR